MTKRRCVKIIHYTTSQGDTFDELALQAYNDEMQAHNIVEANPDYAGVLVFDAGVRLKIPIYESVETVRTLAPWRQVQSQ